MQKAGTQKAQNWQKAQRLLGSCVVPFAFFFALFVFLPIHQFRDLLIMRLPWARGAESHADFVHKFGIVLKELNETSIWLRVIHRSEMLKQEMLAGIIEENSELCRIFTSSLKTARANRK